VRCCIWTLKIYLQHRRVGRRSVSLFLRLFRLRPGIHSSQLITGAVAIGGLFLVHGAKERQSLLLKAVLLPSGLVLDPPTTRQPVLPQSLQKNLHHNMPWRVSDSRRSVIRDRCCTAASFDGTSSLEILCKHQSEGQLASTAFWTLHTIDLVLRSDDKGERIFISGGPRI
jgi:hypothetical protein